jgi:hypothetical protein
MSKITTNNTLMKPNKTNKLPAIMLVLLALTFGSCQWSGETIRGDGHLVTETFSVEYFHSIELAGMFNVTLEQGADLQVVLETDANLHDLISIDVKDEVLEVRTTRDVMLRPTKMELHIIYPELRRMDVGGASRISANRVIVAEDLVFDISGAASIDLEVEVVDLLTKVAGAGDISLEGHARNHTLDLSGASSLSAQRLITESTDIRLSGAGSASVHATRKLNVNLSGVGSVRYYGDPQEKTINKSGLGSIRSGQ